MNNDKNVDQDNMNILSEEVDELVPEIEILFSVTKPEFVIILI